MSGSRVSERDKVLNCDAVFRRLQQAMCKCSFVRVACVALALAAASLAQEYSVDEPNNSDVVFNGEYFDVRSH